MLALLSLLGPVALRIEAVVPVVPPFRRGSVNRILKRCRVFAAGIAVAGALLSCGSSNPPNYPAGPIELKYYATGPWAVTVSLGGACCDSAGNKFDLYYPCLLYTSDAADE